MRLQNLIKSWISKRGSHRERQRSENLQAVSNVTKSPEWEYLGNWRVDDPRIQGWNVPSIANTQKQKWQSFVASLEGPGPLGIDHEAPTNAGRESLWHHNLIMSYAYVLVLACRQKNRLSLLDWGGGIGHYFMISKAVLSEVEIEYYCQDVPVLCDVGRSLLPGVVFFDRPNKCFEQEYDLVFAGSSLWYVEDWQETAVKLANSTRTYLYITRMIFVEEADSYVAVQRPWKYGYKTEYQLWILNQQRFVDHLEKHGVNLVREFLFGEGPHIENAPEQGFFKGFLFRKA